VTASAVNFATNASRLSAQTTVITHVEWLDYGGQRQTCLARIVQQLLDFVWIVGTWMDGVTHGIGGEGVRPTHKKFLSCPAG